MSIKDIITVPSEVLKKISEPIEKISINEKKLIKDLFETMYHSNGIGLAATQVDKHIRLVVMDLSEERNDPRIFVNPEYEILEGYEMFEFEEGCLSIPGFNETIARPDKIKLIWQNLSGETIEDTPEGILTVCIQHEIDHLDGKLMVDYVSALKRDRIRNKLLKDFR